MKKLSTFIQVASAILFGICTLGNGFHWSSLFLLAATILMIPIRAFRNKLKLKNWLIIILAIILFFAGIMFSPLSEDDEVIPPDHSHEWSEATCDSPSVCSICGDTNGEKLEHAWNEASCTEAKACKLCGETEGSAKGHQWKDAT